MEKASENGLFLWGSLRSLQSNALLLSSFCVTRERHYNR